MKSRLLCVGLLLLIGFNAQESISTPTSQLVKDVKFADRALANCVNTYANEQGYRTVMEVHEIPCFHRGITSLSGLEFFTDALVIDLSVNNISDWSPLYGLGQNLGYLDIHQNPIPCSQMIALSRKLPHAYLIGFDPRDCIEDQASEPMPSPVPSQPQPQKPELPSPLPPIQAIIANNCGDCHQLGKHKGGIKFDTEADLSRNSGAALDSILSGQMPPRDKQWKNSPEGQALIAYLTQLASQNPGQGSDHDNDDDGDEGDDD